MNRLIILIITVLMGCSTTKHPARVYYDSIIVTKDSFHTTVDSSAGDSVQYHKKVVMVNHTIQRLNRPAWIAIILAAVISTALYLIRK